MIDYLSIEYTDSSLFNLRNNPLLDFRVINSADSNELRCNHVFAHYKGMDIKIYDSGRTTIKGSLHKFFDENYTNSSDFTYSEVKVAIKSLCSELLIDAGKCIIHKMEFGVNLQSKHCHKRILKSLHHYQRKPFDTPSQFLRVRKLSQYHIKVYDKSKFEKLENPLLRYELHYCKMKPLNDIGISTLKDFFWRPTMESLRDSLIKVWDSILLIDPEYSKQIGQKAVNYDERKFALREYWDELTQLPRSKRNSYLRAHDTYKLSLKLHDFTLQEDVSKEIARKWNDLFYCEDTF